MTRLAPSVIGVRLGRGFGVVVGAAVVVGAGVVVDAVVVAPLL